VVEEFCAAHPAAAPARIKRQVIDPPQRAGDLWASL